MSGRARSRWRSGALAIAALLAADCRVTLEDEHLRQADAAASAVATHTRCTVATPAGLTRGGAFALAFPDGAYWIFGETIVDRGGGDLAFLSSTGVVARDAADPCGGDFAPVVDDAGDWAQLIPLTDEERAADAARADGARTVLWPRAGFVHDGVGIVYYAKILLHDYFHFATLGIGAARITLGGIGERLAPGTWPDEPTLLWAAPQTDWATGALLGEDGRAYVYGCYQRAAFDWACRVARVDPARAGEPAAYEYRTDDGWSPDAASATTIVTGATYLSTAWNEHLGRYLAVYATPLGNDVAARAADDPWGPFDDATTWFTGEAPAEWWIGDVHQQPYYAADGGATLLVSYDTSPAGGTAGMRMVEVELP